MNYQKERCGTCALMTNVLKEDRMREGVMGGCFVTGKIVLTDSEACESHKNGIFEEENGNSDRF